MGSFGRIAIGARGQLSAGEELRWGDAVPPTRRLDFVTESFSNEIGNLVSESLDPSRGISKRVRGVSNISGDFAIEQNTEGYEIDHKHALGDSVTINKCDAGVRAQVTTAYTGAALTIDTDALDADWIAPGGNGEIIAVYKHPTSGLLTVTASRQAYTVLSSGTFTIPGFVEDLPVGAWILQCSSHATAWADVNSHWIEAAAVLPAGQSFEVGRDIAFFVYSGVKMNTLELTFTAQEICTGSFGTLGKGEYLGGLLASAVTAADTSVTIEKFGTTNTTSVSEVVFTGSGIDDAASGGSFSGDEESHYIVKVSLAAATDEFDWSDDGGLTYTTNVAMTGAAQALSNGVTVTFTATTGHTLADQWDFATGDIIGFNPAGGTLQMETENDITYTGVNVYSGVISGIPSSGANSISVDHAAGLPCVPQTSWGTPTDPPSTDPISSFEGALYIDGVFNEVLSASITLNNNMYADKFQLGDRNRAGLPEQQRSVEGTLDMEFDDTVQYKRYTEGLPSFLEIKCVQDSERIDTSAPAGEEVYRQKHILCPHIEYTGDTPNIGGPDQITHNMPFTALRDADNNMNEMAVVYVNTTTSI